jgi:hypothetical protein
MKLKEYLTVDNQPLQVSNVNEQERQNWKHYRNQDKNGYETAALDIGRE